MYVNARFHDGFFGANDAAVLPSTAPRVAAARANSGAPAQLRTAEVSAPVVSVAKTLAPSVRAVAVENQSVAPVKTVRVGDMTISPVAVRSTTNAPSTSPSLSPSAVSNLPAAKLPAAPTLVRQPTTVRVGDMTISPTVPPAPLGPPEYTSGSGGGGGGGGSGDLGPLAPPEPVEPAAAESGPALETYSLTPADAGSEVKVGSGTVAAPSGHAWLWWILALAAGGGVLYVALRKPKGGGGLQGLNESVRGAKLVMPDLRSGRMLAWWAGSHEAIVVDRDGQVTGKVATGTTLETARQSMARYLRGGR